MQGWASIFSKKDKKISNKFSSILTNTLQIANPPPSVRKITPEIFSGKDIAVQTKIVPDKGKVVSYLVPIFYQIYSDDKRDANTPSAIILCPSREYALQVNEISKVFSTELKITCSLAIGGEEDLTKVGKKLQCDIVVCTFGRLEQYIANKIVDVSNVKFLVIDEADSLIESDKILEDIDKILDPLPKERLTAIFSTITTINVKALIKKATKETVAEIELGIVKGVQHNYAVIPYDKRFSYLIPFLKEHANEKIVIFFTTSNAVQYNANLLRYAYESNNYGTPIEDCTFYILFATIPAEDRKKTFEAFLEAKKGVLLTTHVSAVELSKIDWIVHYYVTKDPIQYIRHSKILSKNGKSLIFIDASEFPYVEKLISYGLNFEEMTTIIKQYTPFQHEAFLKSLPGFLRQKLKQRGKEAYKSLTTVLKKVHTKEKFNLITESVAKSFSGLQQLTPITLEDDDEEEEKKEKKRENKGEKKKGENKGEKKEEKKGENKKIQNGEVKKEKKETKKRKATTKPPKAKKQKQ